MLTFDELLSEIKRRPLDEKLMLLEALNNSVQEEAAANKPATPKKSRIMELQGLLKPEGPLPSDEQLKEAYTDYLNE
jgi:hypothetical protein